MTGYADPELLVAAWLNERLGCKTWADPQLPGNDRFASPIVHVQRGQGAGQVPLSLDDVTLDVDVYAAKADSARRVAADVWTAMTLTLPLTTFGNGAFVKGCWAITPPFWAPDPSVVRRSAAYRVMLHALV